MSKRVQLDFSDAAFDRLTALGRDGNTQGNAETIRQALRLYEWYLQKQKDGLDVVAIHRASGRQYQVVLDK